MVDAANDWEEAFQAILDRSDSDIEGFLFRWFSSTTRLNFVVDHLAELRKCDLFEQALLCAWTGTKTNIRNWTRGFTQDIFAICDRDRLLAAGQPLPGSGPFELYRGVAGKGAARRKYGFSWTSSLAKARWFAAWHVHRYQLPNPTVYRTVVEKKDVLAYSNDRQEEEFLVLLKPNHKIEIVERMSEAAVAESLAAESRRARQQFEEFLARYSDSGKED
jgi:hypothetical protein